jgi:hypothetical protein
MTLGWHERPVEVRGLMNPAFVALVVVNGAIGYFAETGTGVPYSLTYLITPIVMHAETRNQLPSSIRTSLPAWLSEHEYLRETFPPRARMLATPTREGVAIGLATGVLTVAARGTLEPGKPLAKGQPVSQTEQTRLILHRSRFVGRWFGRVGSPTTVFALWGVSP